MAERHPVADLLTDEMKARVRAATFGKHRSVGKRARVTAKIGRYLCCPLGVALGRYGDGDSFRFPCVGVAVNLLGVPNDDAAWDAVHDFTEKVDSGRIEPADVKALLGCEETADA